MNYSLDEVLLAGISVIILLTLFFMQRKLSRLGNQYTRLQYEFQVANKSAIGLGKQVLSLEKQIYEISSHSPTMEESPVVSKKSFKATPLTVVNSKKESHSKENDLSDDSLNGKAHNNEQVSDEVYELSRQLLARGYEIDDVIRQSGLSYSEVSLIKALEKSH